MKLPTAQEMLELDRSASEDFGIPSVVLMENAGVATVMMMEKELGPCSNSYAVIFIGPGNNGGDGLVIGRHLHQRGCLPMFFILVNPGLLRGDAAVNLAIVKKLRLPFHIIDNAKRVETIPVLLQQMETRGLPCYVVVDAIFGVGLNREVSGHFADAIDLINGHGVIAKVPRVAVDIPSGVDSDTGKALGTCVRANYTATYCCAKPGHFLHGGSEWTGKLSILDIGIPLEAIDRAKINTELATLDTYRQLSKPLQRHKGSHKGTHGHLLIIAGSRGKSGAAILCGKGALRCGAGLVSLGVPTCVHDLVESLLIEAMTVFLTHSQDHLVDDDWPTLADAARGKKAVVVGPGLGTEESTAALVLRLYRQLPVPMVLDADALNILAEHRHVLPEAGGPRIFTPHPGELSRLLQKEVNDIQNNRIDAALLGSNLIGNVRHDNVLVLKGAGTIIAGADGTLFINTTGNPGMASGGMGDVLAGMIGALLCQGLSPMDAAVAGVYLHGAAGDHLYRQNGVGFLASQVADAIPEVAGIQPHNKKHCSGQALPTR
jgi:ADP-dependent NAD(P)H-hydrate dehydratase / NAD(P)H-hydrate epimerase